VPLHTETICVSDLVCHLCRLHAVNIASFDLYVMFALCGNDAVCFLTGLHFNLFECFDILLSAYVYLVFLSAQTKEFSDKTDSKVA